MKYILEKISGNDLTTIMAYCGIVLGFIMVVFTKKQTAGIIIISSIFGSVHSTKIAPYIYKVIYNIFNIRHLVLLIAVAALCIVSPMFFMVGLISLVFSTLIMYGFMIDVF